jgi:hypothetical protein
MDVSKLTDVELNRAMIWCYPLWGSIWMVDQTGAQMIERRGWINPVDYLADWGLTMPLAVENHLDMDFDGKMWRIYGPSASYSKHKILIRAICETLVMIALEKK